MLFTNDLSSKEIDLQVLVCVLADASPFLSIKVLQPFTPIHLEMELHMALN